MQDYREKMMTMTMLNKFFLTIDPVEIICFLENHKSLRQRVHVFCCIIEVNIIHAIAYWIELQRGTKLTLKCVGDRAPLQES